MKTTTSKISGLIVMMLLFVFSNNVFGQSQSTTQTVCFGLQDYWVEAENPTVNILLWEVIGGVAGTDYTISSTNTENTEINWLTDGDFTLRFTETNADGCSTIVEVDVTVQPSPAAPTNPENQTECATNPLQTLTAAVTVPASVNVVWYDSPTGGNIVASPTLNAIGTITYYAEAQVGTCFSSTRTPVTLTINPAPTTSPIWHN